MSLDILKVNTERFDLRRRHHRRRLLLLKESNFGILEKALNFSLALLQSIKTCLSNFTSISIVITSRPVKFHAFGVIFRHIFSCTLSRTH